MSSLLRLLAVQVKISLRRTSTTAVTTQCYVVVHAASKLVCCLARKPRPEAHVWLRACMHTNVYVCVHMMRTCGSGHAMSGCVLHTQMQLGILTHVCIPICLSAALLEECMFVCKSIHMYVCVCEQTY
jgi:hypothetical protein